MVRQAKAEEREHLESQLAQQKEEARRVQEKLQEENNVCVCVCVCVCVVCVYVCVCVHVHVCVYG